MLKTKKYIKIFLAVAVAIAILLVISLVCSSSNLDKKNNLKYYVVNQHNLNNVFCEKDVTDIDGLNKDEIIARIINLISNDESIKDLLLPTSEVPIINTVTINEGSAILSFRDNYMFDSPLSHQLFKSCLIKSLCSTDWINDVVFLGRDLDDPTKNPIRYTIDSIVEDFDELKTIPTDIYYVSPSGNKLIKEVKYYYENYAEDMTSFIIRQIAKGPLDGDYSKILPNRFSSYSTHIENGLCTITFNEEFEQWEIPDYISSQCFIQSIVNSLCSSPDIDSVKISFSYKANNFYKGIDISKPFYFDDSLVDYSEN